MRATRWKPTAPGARGAASDEAARELPGYYFFEPLLFVDRFAPFFVPFRAPFFFVGIVSTLQKRCWWCGASRARNH